jgi:UDPglucose 6-dehydrogenase
MIGSGYVGLVSGACFAHFGHDVFCVDKDAGKIDRLLNGVMPIYEPGLDKLVADNVEAGRLKFGTDLAAAAVGDADAVFIAVGTPTRRGDGHADLTYVYAAAARSRGRSGYTVVVTKSTVPVGTNARWRGSSARRPAPSSTWRRTRSSCARARRSTTSCGPTAW